MHRYLIFRRHVEDDGGEPVVLNGGQEIRGNAQPRAAERRGHGIAAEGDGIIAGNILVVSGGNVVGDESDVDIGLADKEGFHMTTLNPARRLSSSVVDLKFLRFSWHSRLGTSNPKTTLDSINC